MSQMPTTRHNKPNYAGPGPKDPLPAGHFRIGRGKISSLMPGHGGGISSIAKKPERQAPSTTNSAVDKDTAVDKSGSLVAGQESIKAGKASAGVCHYNPWFQDVSRSEVSKSLAPGLPMDTAPRANFSAAGLKNTGLERLRDWRMKRHRRCCMENRAIFGSTAQRAWMSLDVWMKSQQFSTHRCPH